MSKKSVPALLLLPAGVLLTTLAGRVPALVERLYSRSFYPFIGRCLSTATGLLPFSLAEILVFAFLLSAVCFLLRGICLLAKDKRTRREKLANFLFSFLYGAGILYLAFNLVWGLNYYREPLSATLGLDTRPATAAELESLCRYLLAQANSLRLRV
ncbi:MAG TPA: DUF3810 domain-containing protein, partial [Firmicutes bacterium]|nr:DUF3810 domain-containing protein [Bacillota bacterium]